MAIVTSLAVAAAVFTVAIAVQSSLGITRRAVQARTLTSGDAVGVETRRPRIMVPPLMRLSERGRRLALDLERAGLAFTVTEYLTIRAACGILLAVAFFLLGASLDFAQMLRVLGSVPAFVVGYRMPTWYVAGRKAKRLSRVEDQLLDALVSMAKSLRAGVGITQALEYAARELGDPLGSELLRVVRELQLGADIEVVLEEANARVGSPDLGIVSTAIIIQRRVGGNLSEILTNVANTIRERRNIRRDLHSVTSKQRLQGNLSALLPPFVALLFFAINPDMAEVLVTTTVGRISLAVGIFFELSGLWLVRRLAQIEV